MKNKIIEFAEKRGEERGEKRNAETNAKKMIAKGYDIKEIEEITGFSREELNIVVPA